MQREELERRVEAVVTGDVFLARCSTLFIRKVVNSGPVL